MTAPPSADPSDRLYLDHAATTPILSEVRAAMANAMAEWANPSSPHAEGRRARSAFESARATIADALGWDGEIILTSGATEAITIALTRAKAPRVLVSAVEHDAVLRSVPDAPRIPVGRRGRVFPAALEGALADSDTRSLVAIQTVNNETGVVQDSAALLALVREAGGLMLADASQSAGKLPLPQADFIAVSAHKLGGPPGVGALLVRDLAELTPAGGQEKGYRGGTENLPGVIGFATALTASRNWIDRAADLRRQLEHAIAAGGGEVIADGAQRLATIGAYRMAGTPATAQLIQFDMAGIAVSAGSACSSGTLKPSHVLKAMGLDDAAVGEVIRVSFGPQTRREDVYRFIEVWRSVAARAKASA